MQTTFETRIPVSHDLHVAVEPLPASLPVVAAPQTSAVQLLERGLALEGGMHRATRDHGDPTPNAGVSWFRGSNPFVATAVGIGLAAAGFSLAGESLGPLPMFAGIAAAGLSYWGLDRLAAKLTTHRRLSSVDEQATKPLVEAFVSGDAAQRRLVAGLAETWSQRMSRHTIGGVYARRELDSLRGDEPVVSGAEAEVLKIIHELNDDRGAVRTTFESASLASLGRHVAALPPDERAGVASLLIAKLYVKEKPTFRCGDPNAVQQLLYALVSHLPFAGGVKNAAA